MKENKVKVFYQKHKKKILLAGGAVTVVVLGALLSKKRDDEPSGTADWPTHPSDDDRMLAEKYDGWFENGCTLPFVSKENATKFMEESGDTYQITDMDDLSSTIWISKSKGVESVKFERIDG